MTPPPDAAVAALAEAIETAYDEAGAEATRLGSDPFDVFVHPYLTPERLIAALHAAGWILSRRSDHEAAAAAEARVAVLEEAAREYLAHDGSGVGEKGEWSGDYHALKRHDALLALRAALVAGEGEGDG